MEVKPGLSIRRRRGHTTVATSSRIIAMCAAGPSKAAAPSRRSKKASSPREVGVGGSGRAVPPSTAMPSGRPVLVTLIPQIVS
jgi:hypothetical protein